MKISCYMVAILAAAGTSLSAMDEVPELLGTRGGGPWTPEHRNMEGGEKLVQEGGLRKDWRWAAAKDAKRR